MANSSLPPMTAINVVTAALRLYRDRFSTYFPIGVIAALWSLIPIVAAIPIPFLIFFQIAEPSIIWAVSPIWLILLIFTSAKSITNFALISRLAFGVLINKPETVTEARSHVMPKMWKFWIAYFWIFLLTTAVSFVCGLLAGILFVILAGIIIQMLVGSPSGISGIQSPTLFYGLGLLFLIMMVPGLIVVTRLAIGFSLTEVPLAVENNLTAWETIQRSEYLIKGYAGKVLKIFIFPSLIIIPLLIVAGFLDGILQKILVNVLYMMNPQSPAFIAIYYLLGWILGTGLAVFVYPFYQIIKSLIYYDLRARKEGIE